MRITEQHLIDILDIPAARAAKWCEPLNAACARYGIVSALQMAAFIAQIGHESGRFRYVRELWGPTPAQQRYEGRADLGNTQLGDGSRFRGRGLIQITGRSNYASAATHLGLDLLAQPKLLEQPEHAAMSAAWFWESRNINQLADEGDIRAITRLINGGYNGLKDRQSIYAKAVAVFAS